MVKYLYSGGGYVLAMSDIDINIFLPVFARAGVPVAFLVPTATGYEKSIMDATGPVRTLLKNEGIHDYYEQGQGQENKVIVEAYFVTEQDLIKTEASLYRPCTKNGDPRIWFKGLKKYCSPYNLLALAISEGKIYVFNLSDIDVRSSLFENRFVAGLLDEFCAEKESVAQELLYKIQKIHNRGFIPSVTSGDPGVGDTLEDALGIRRNNSRSPDYKGIELKTTRMTRNGSKRATTRTTLFTRVPDEGMTYREIVDNYGKWQIPRDSEEERFQLYETFRVSRPNSYGLQLEVDINDDRLRMLSVGKRAKRYISSWYMENLRKALLLKHHETFWVKATSIMKDGREYFRYDVVLHTKNPNTALLPYLFEEDIITVDLAAHYKPDGKWRDHGVLFKMLPKDIPLLLGEPIEYIL